MNWRKYYQHQALPNFIEWYVLCFDWSAFVMSLLHLSAGRLSGAIQLSIHCFSCSFLVMLFFYYTYFKIGIYFLFSSLRREAIVTKLLAEVDTIRWLFLVYLCCQNFLLDGDVLGLGFYWNLIHNQRHIVAKTWIKNDNWEIRFDSWKKFLFLKTLMIIFLKLNRIAGFITTFTTVFILALDLTKKITNFVWMLQASTKMFPLMKHFNNIRTYKTALNYKFSFFFVVDLFQFHLI